MKIRVAVHLLLGALAAPVFAADYTDSAPVISSVPIYQTVVEPQQQCWTESVTRYEEHRSAGGVILGGITGGLIGSTIGRHNGRAASAVVGAVIGAVVGDHIANRDNNPVAVTRPIQRCQTVENQRQVVTGYQVTYNYNGRNTTVAMPYDPGARVPIDVGVITSARQPAYLSPPVAQITYLQHRAPVWEQKPYRRPRYDRDWDRR